jgi:hypothetical protein
MIKDSYLFYRVFSDDFNTQDVSTKNTSPNESTREKLDKKFIKLQDERV